MIRIDIFECISLCMLYNLFLFLLIELKIKFQLINVKYGRDESCYSDASNINMMTSELVTQNVKIQGDYCLYIQYKD